MFEKWCMKRKVEVCELNGEMRKKFVRMVVCSFYVKIFGFGR